MKQMRQIVKNAIGQFDKLGLRLALVFAIALLPLMLVSIIRSQSVINEALERSQAALVGETLRAAQGEVNLIESAKAVAQSLSRIVPTVLSDPESCQNMMKDILTHTQFSFAGYYDVTGYVPCSSADAPFSFGMTPNLQEQLRNPVPTVLVNQEAPISGTSVIYASEPVYSKSGVLTGFAAISVPHKFLREGSEVESAATVMTLNASGVILTAPGSLDFAQTYLPQDRLMSEIASFPESFRADGVDGIARIYATVPVVSGELFALATWPAENETGGGYYLSNPTLFPLLMWLASLAVAWFASSIFVTRHVVQIRTSMKDFATSRKVTPMANFDVAPVELRDVADAFSGLTDTILHEEAKLEDTSRQKDILLREVHHRVKNNLQLIASIMNMQMRQSRSPEVHRLMRNLHDRVNSLATIHRNLYQTSGQADVTMDEHLNTIVRQVVRMSEERDRKINVKTDFAPLTLNPDQAVPLSLFVTEAMTNALKYIGAPDGKKLELHVTVRRPEPQIAEVIIENSLPANPDLPDPEKSSGLGSELMEAFCAQLEGDMSRSQDAEHFKVTLSFPIEELSAKQAE